MQICTSFGENFTSPCAKTGANLHLFLHLQGVGSEETCEEPGEGRKNRNSHTKSGQNPEFQNNLTAFRKTNLTARLFLASFDV